MFEKSFEKKTFLTRHSIRIESQLRTNLLLERVACCDSHEGEGRHTTGPQLELRLALSDQHVQTTHDAQLKFMSLPRERCFWGQVVLHAIVSKTPQNVPYNVNEHRREMIVCMSKQRTWRGKVNSSGQSIDQHSQAER